jgi:uncharacterized membrane protein YfcA
MDMRQPDLHHDTAGSAQRVARPSKASVLQEVWRQQLPIIAALLAAGFAAAYLQHGYLPGGDRPFPLAGVRVPIWHLIWMGVWTGYVMALVGQAAGILALPYSTSVLQFDNPHVTPTMLVLTLFNPVGALLGFRRGGQWNLDFAAAVCGGGLVGGLIGPFLRATVLADADAFRTTLGAALVLFGLQLCYGAIRDYHRFGRRSGWHFLASSQGGEQANTYNKVTIETTLRSFSRIRIRFGSEERQLSNIHLFIAGLGVGIFSSALGVGGGFLLVPIFANAWRLPIYIMVAATIPYTLVLSLAGILTFIFVLPLMGTPASAPEWSWGFFTAAGGVFGSWCASKNQIYVPEHFLALFLGGMTGLAGLLYVLNSVGPQ